MKTYDLIIRCLTGAERKHLADAIRMVRPHLVIELPDPTPKLPAYHQTARDISQALQSSLRGDVAPVEPARRKRRKKRKVRTIPATPEEVRFAKCAIIDIIHQHGPQPGHFIERLMVDADAIPLSKRVPRVQWIKGTTIHNMLAEGLLEVRESIILPEKVGAFGNKPRHRYAVSRKGAGWRLTQDVMTPWTKSGPVPVPLTPVVA